MEICTENGQFKEDLDSMKIIGSFEITDVLLGNGHFGQLYKSRNRNNDQREVATRKLCISDTNRDYISLLCRIPCHPNIIQTICSTEEDGFLWLVQEYIPFNLETYLACHGVTFIEKFQMIKQLVAGIDFLHGSGVVNGNIKPSNILLMKNDSGMDVKYTDFGGHVKTVPECLAPELYKNNSDDTRSFAADIFALGVIFLGILRFEGESDFHDFMYVSDKKIPIAEYLCQINRTLVSHWTPLHIQISDPDYLIKVKILINNMLNEKEDQRPKSKGIVQYISKLAGVQHVAIVKQLKSLCFDCEVWAGFGYNGECLIAAVNESRYGKSSSSLTLYKLSQAPSTFQHLWRKPLPDDMPVESTKYITESGKIILHYRGTSIVYDKSMMKICKHTPTIRNVYTRLCAIHNDLWLFCDMLNGEIVVYDLNTYDYSHTIRLQRCYREEFKSLLCCHPTENLIAVVCYQLRFLEIFNDEGASFLNKELNYTPCLITSSENYLIMSEWESPNLHVHDWDGDELFQISSSQLGLDRTERICGMSPVSNGLLMLSTWCQINEDESDKIIAYMIEVQFEKEGEVFITKL